MKKNFRFYLNRTLLILIISLVIITLDYLVFSLSQDDSIWLGESIEAVVSVIFGPVTGGLVALISCTLTDYLTYHSFEYIVVSMSETLAIILIGLIYRRLVRDEDKFGIREIAIFNFIQILVNMGVIYLSTPPAAVLFFEFILEGWSRADFATEMKALSDNAFSSCIAIALIGTVLLAICTTIRKHFKEQGSIGAALRSIFKLSFISKEYRKRALEYSAGIFFAIALTMVDGVVSGHVLGENALAATSLMFPLVSLSTFISNIITSGCSNLCARAKGDGNYKRARELFTLGFFTTIALGVIHTVLYYLTENLYFGYFTSSPVIETFAREYYQFYIFVPPFMALATFMDEMVSSDGDDTLSYAGYLTPLPSMWDCPLPCQR